MMEEAVTAPVARKVRHEVEMFGDVRVDNYYWLRDDSPLSNPDVISHLQQENAYTDFVMQGTKHLEDEIYAEMKARLKEDDSSAPVRRGSYYYYLTTIQDQQYVQHCRRPISITTTTAPSPPSVYDTMPADAPEQVILDENIKAKQHAYYRLDAFKVSPNNELIAYAEDTKGNEMYTVYVINADTGAYIGEPILDVTSDLEWAGDNTLVYLTMDDTLRTNKVFLHKLGSNQSGDLCLYHEKDDRFSLNLKVSESKRFLFIGSRSKTTQSVFYLDIMKEDEQLQVLTPRINGIDTTVSHRGNHFFMKRRSDVSYNSELLVCTLDDTSDTTLLLPHSESVKMQNIQLFTDHLVVYVRKNGLPNVIVYNLPAEGQPITSLQEGRDVEFFDPIYSVEPSQSQFSSSVLRLKYSSLKTPPSVYDYDLNTGISVLKKTETVLGGFDASNYVTERKWASASDGTQVPISIVYRKNFVKLDGSNPLLLYGYGSYEVCKDPSFSASRLSLLDRGFIFALAHVRGGGEMGRQWYENGKLLKKRNTFSDFIACAEYLIENKYSSKEKLCIHGRSAGGLLIGAVLNMRPDLFKAAVAGVPFVDVVTTMLDPTIPLTTSEWEEWGDPRKEEFYFYMKSYSPVDNVRAQKYPNILVTTGLNDPRVLYFEPAKLVAKMREMKTNDSLLLFKCELGSGHFSMSGRFEKLREDAFTFAFILKALDMVPSVI
ncbi:hypothetical protein AQUCO_09100092v1 [Aquilegia coerulea]|uniref:Prolyl endopeptidase n=1 Tax=Aquilegia coerulea TaxID=218851 RepID=A0A2G5C5Z8_AQUCA|nr:hypothetical protein AQUCO_09100092v1 [Aquilegia coerulea]